MPDIDEYIDEQGRRTYNGVDIIPYDVPHRYGRTFYWNQTTHYWDDIQWPSLPIPDSPASPEFL